MFTNRQDAGRKLASRLVEGLGSLDSQKAVVLAIPRGGIVVGKEIASKFFFPLDVLVAKKLPAPQNQELAIGAVGENGKVFFDEQLCRDLCVTEAYKSEIVKKKLIEVEEKRKFFRGRKLPLDLEGKTVVLTDDGVATGATMLMAIRIVREFHPHKIIVAIPVIALSSLGILKNEADQVFYLESPEIFIALGQFYHSFLPVTDEQVVQILGGE